MNKQTKHTLGVISVILGTLVALVFFQNCSQIMNSESLKSPSDSGLIDFFQYKYTKKPNLYSNLALIFPSENEIGNFAVFRIQGMLVPANGSNGEISYNVSITDDTGKSICAGDSGILEPGEQNFDFECLGKMDISKAHVEMAATYNQIQENFQATFTKD
ncbi:MAG: hypothetical protein J0M15_15050 [Deltaproteobacteria bacterium]|nr:hypothetical protein [Deltaproteobacteria bacterium]